MPEGDQTTQSWQASWTAKTTTNPQGPTPNAVASWLSSSENKPAQSQKSSIPSHTASLISNYTKADWSKWTKFTEICTIYENEKGWLMVKIPKWMLLTGDIYISAISDARKQVMQDAIDAKRARQAESNQEDEDDLPF